MMKLALGAVLRDDIDCVVSGEDFTGAAMLIVATVIMVKYLRTNKSIGAKLRNVKGMGDAERENGL
jgi:hypothetical protein